MSEPLRIRKRNPDGTLTDWQKVNPNEKTKDEIIAELQEKLAVKEREVSQLNGDFAAFLDFYFSQFPEQA